jgi:adenylosuccinate lyase
MSNRAISPLDGRYQTKTTPLQDYLSEWALMKYRVLVEVRWLIAMSEEAGITHVRSLTDAEVQALNALVDNFDDESADQIKDIERTTNHDVKAVEYFIKQNIANTSLEDVSESVHFACTSEDINNLAYAMMFRDAIQSVWQPQAQLFLTQLTEKAQSLAGVSILARTHGQSATPTTMGKELHVFIHRLQRQLKQIANQEFLGKLNGAVGAYNAHYIAYPDVDWHSVSRHFVESLGLTHNPFTTQIEPHDYMAELGHSLMRFNTILLDFCRDMWSYISLGYFKQRVVAGEVGSSTMPHKVNPIDFENSEANLGISNANLDHLASKLPVSRLQRDLSDSSALRNYGVGIGHSLLGILSAQKGLGKTDINQSAIDADLNDAWEILGEAVQTVLRKHSIPNAYEKLKDLTRGTRITAEILQKFIKSLDIPDDDKTRLLELTPAGYIGYAEQLVQIQSD